MRIAVDARPLCIKEASGIPTYLRCLLKALGEIDQKNEYFLYAHRDFSWEGPPGFKWRKRFGSNIYGTIWMQTLAPFWIQKDEIDLFWGTQHVLPLTANRRVRTALTVHDLIYLRLPQTMAMKNLWINRLFIGPSIRRADAIAAVSGATARDVEDLMLIPSEKIRVVHSGVEEDYRPVNKTAARTALKYLLKTDKPVLLSVGTMEPRKNLLGAVEAFSRICHRFPHDLCVVGPPGWKMTGILKKIRRREVYHRIKWLGYVPRPLMPALYSLADVFLFPSFYEGFGLPPLEAMSCGTPVISSNTSCMPETLGDAAIFVDPRDTKAMASAMVRLLSDPVLSQDLAGRGIDWSAHFRWHITGKKMVEIFERASA